MKLHVAIVAYRFKPEPTIGAVRPSNWAQWLGATYDVEVITSTSTTASAQEPFRVTTITAPLRRLFENARARTRNVSGGSARTKVSMAAKLWRPLFQYLTDRGVASQRLPAIDLMWSPKVLYHLYRSKPDIVICTYGPPSAIVVSWFAIKLFRLNVIVDYRDLYSLSDACKGFPGVNFMESMLDRAVLRQATHITTVSSGLAKVLTACAGEGRVSVIYNSSDVNSRISAPRNLPYVTAPGETTLTYFGTVNRWRDAKPLFRVISELDREGVISPSTLKILFASRSGGSFIKDANLMGAGRYIVDLGAIGRDVAHYYESQAAGCILLESETDNGNVTGKLFEYISIGVPILVVGPSRNSELAQIIEIAGASAYYGAEIADFLRARLGTVPTHRSTVSTESGRALVERSIATLNSIVSRYAQQN